MVGPDHGNSRTQSAAERDSTIGRAGRLRTWLVMLLAGGLAGLAGWASLEHLSDTFELPRALADISPPYSDEVGQRIETALRDIALKNRTLCLGVFGALGGGFFGVAAASLIRSGGKVYAGPALGVVVGGVFGAAAGALGLLAGEAFDAQNSISHAAAARDAESMWALYGGMVTHITTWMLVGAGYGIAVGVISRPNGRVFPTVLAACGAAALWGAIYPFLGAVLFPMSSPEQAVPSGTGLRLVWSLAGSLLVAAAISRVIAGRAVSSEVRPNQTEHQVA